MRDERINSLQIILLWIPSLFPSSISAIVFLVFVFSEEQLLSVQTLQRQKLHHRQAMGRMPVKQYSEIRKTITVAFHVYQRWGLDLNAPLAQSRRKSPESQLPTVGVGPRTSHPLAGGQSWKWSAHGCPLHWLSSSPLLKEEKTLTESQGLIFECIFFRGFLFFLFPSIMYRAPVKSPHCLEQCAQH